MELIRAEGLSVLPWNRRAAELHSRLNFLRRRLGDPWPDLSESALLDRLEEWLLPFLPPKLRQDTLRTLPMAEALSSLLPWELRSRADELAPERITLPSGSTRRLRYEEERCILSARIQQLFGLSETPRVAGTEVELELLSPAERPVQHTRDIASFWRHTYPEVRRELRGRYPKHYWPEDPLRATPTDRSKRRRDS
jgi:ATP-dependent helicase HrpB